MKVGGNMLDISITNQQKQYLLYFLESETLVTLPKVAAHFQCSKVNSKKIIDRMVHIGLVYKENNKIYLTDLGHRLAVEHQHEQQDMALVLHEGLGIEKESAEELASTMLIEESRGMRKQLLSMARYFSQVADRQGDSISAEEIIEILGVGKFKTYFVVFRDETGPERDAFMPLSMALEGFYKDALICIDENGENSIEMRTKAVDKNQDGKAYRGKAKLIIFYSNGERETRPIGQVCRLPFEVIKEWYYVGGGILQASLDLCIVPDSPVTHQQFAQFVFTINLFNL